MTNATGISSIPGLVLAAGYSSRMGAFKPLLPMGGGTAVQCAIDSFAGAGLTDIRVVVGYRADEVAEAARAAGASVVNNPDYDKGMFSSIQTGIASLDASCPGCLLLPVDVPLVMPETVRQVAMTALHSRAAVVHPVCGQRRGHPPYLGRALFGEILADQTGEGGLRALLARHQDMAAVVAVDDEGILRDMDTPADYHILQAMAARRQAKADLATGLDRAP